MSLGVIIKASEGLVLAAESRVTLSAGMNTPTGVQQIHVSFDNATKLLTFNGANKFIGAVTYGTATIGFRTVHSFIPEFETGLIPEERHTVENFSIKLSAFFLKQWTDGSMPGPQNPGGHNMTFEVAGYNAGEPYGRMYSFEIPNNPTPVEQSAGKDNFGIRWGGQREVVDRLLLGYDSRLLNILAQNGKINPTDIAGIQSLLASQLQLALPIQFMPLQDCIDLAVLFIRTTINAQRLTVGLRGCGGAIDVAIITRNNPLTFIQKKNLIVEQ
jgi:hypothetical protein